MLRNPLGKASERALGNAMERTRAHPLEVLARARPHERHQRRRQCILRRCWRRCGLVVGVHCERPAAGRGGSKKATGESVRVSVRRCALRWASFVLLLFLSFIIIFSDGFVNLELGQDSTQR